MHNPYIRADLPLGVCKGTVTGLCKMVEIPTNHITLQYTATEVIPIYI